MHTATDTLLPFPETTQHRDIAAGYEVVRQYTEDLCEPLQLEDYIPQPVDFVSPPKWHLAHTSWFFEEFILVKFCPDYQRYHPDFSYLFNSYYNHMGSRVMRTDRGNITRPGVEEVYRYRSYVNEAMRKLLAEVTSPELEELIILGLNHEQQHQELLITDLKYIFGHNPIFPVYKKNFSLTEVANADSGWALVKSGLYEIGFDKGDFCYDNELGRHQVYLEDFEISKALVTNGEYLEFIDAGGYQNFRYWLA